MGMWVGRGRKARVAYGFDDIALVPGAVTSTNEVDISWELCGHRYDLPIIAAAMDGVVGPKLATEMGRHGGLGVLNLEASSPGTRTPPKCSNGSSRQPGRGDQIISRSTASRSRKT
jgi:IMP dehydrogenase